MFRCLGGNHASTRIKAISKDLERDDGSAEESEDEESDSEDGGSDSEDGGSDSDSE